MKSPILRLEAEFAGLSLENDGSVAFAAHHEREQPEHQRQDQRHPSRPSPAHVVIHDDETPRDRTRHGPNEHRSREQTEGETALHRTPEVSESPADDSHCGGAEHALQETEEHDGFDVTGDGDGDLEDGEDEVADEEGGFAAVEFACGRKGVSVVGRAVGEGGVLRGPQIMGPRANPWMRVSMRIVVMERGGGRTSTISAVPSVMTSVDTPNSFEVTCVAVLNMLLEKVRVKVMVE